MSKDLKKAQWYINREIEKRGRCGIEKHKEALAEYHARKVSYEGTAFFKIRKEADENE